VRPPLRARAAAGPTGVWAPPFPAPAIEPAQGKVATNSAAVVTGILRQELGFKGLVVTDAMDMAGLTGVYPEGGAAAARHAAIDSINAGNDMLLLITDLDGADNRLLEAVRKGGISEKRLDETVLKDLEAKAR